MLKNFKDKLFKPIVTYKPDGFLISEKYVSKLSLVSFIVILLYPSLLFATSL